MTESTVLDTSAFFAFVDDEEGADMVEKQLRAAQRGHAKLMASFVSLTELRYITLQEKGESAADYLTGLVKTWPVEWIQSNETLCLLAARYKATCRLSLADAFVAATTKLARATLLHKDPEFEALGSEFPQICLPRKTKG